MKSLMSMREAAVRRLALYGAVSVLGSLCCLSASAADRFEDVRGYIRDGLVAESVPSIALSLQLRGDVLSGTAMANDTPGGLRQRSTLGHWLALKKVP